MTPEQILEHYRDVQAGLKPTYVRGEPVFNTPENPLYRGWAFKHYLRKPFLHLTKDMPAVRVLDHGCGKASYLYDERLTGHLLHRELQGRLQSYYCYDPGYRPYMKPPSCQFNVLVSAGVMSVIPEEHIDTTFVEMRQWLEPDGIALFKIPLTAKAERTFEPSGESVYITVKPPEYWLDKLNNVLQRRYYVTFADNIQEQIKYKRL